MKYRGVVYDVGLRFTEGEPYSVGEFDPLLAEYDINAIANQLHANAIRIEGEDVTRLAAASRIAHRAGLTVFFNPWKMNAPHSDLTEYFARAAQVAEALRAEGVDVIFVAGCEMTLFNAGIIEGASVAERVATLSRLFIEPNPDGPGARLEEMKAPLNETLRDIVGAVRKNFSGPITYSAGMWELVDWSVFDIVGLDHYRSAESAKEYVDALDRYRQGKPLVVMEVGSCAYEGAGKRGAAGFMPLLGQHPDGRGIFADEIVPTRDEREQGDYVEEQIALLNEAQISGVFIYVFSFPSFPIGTGDRDLDMMAFSIVKTYPDSDPRSKVMPPWEPKDAFRRIAHVYGSYR